MADWPEAADVKAWMRSKQFVVDDDPALDDVTASATTVIRAWLDITLLPDDVDDCPNSVRQAIIMRAAALYVRRDSPTGIITFSETDVFRVNKFDADVDFLIAPYRAAMVG